MLFNPMMSPAAQLTLFNSTVVVSKASAPIRLRLTEAHAVWVLSDIPCFHS